MNASDALQTLKVIPYTATSLSVVGRFIFMFLLYKNKSTNSLSLLFCILSIISSSMWIYYSVQMNDTPLVMRSSTEITLLFLSAMYIIKNKVSVSQGQVQVHPEPSPTAWTWTVYLFEWIDAFILFTQYICNKNYKIKVNGISSWSNQGSNAICSTYAVTQWPTQAGRHVETVTSAV